MGYRNGRDGRGILRDRGRLRQGLRAPGERPSQEGAGQVIESVLLIFIIVLLMAYLIFALLRPEKF